MAGAGIATAALCSGGTDETNRLAQTESWNGTNWTEVNDLNNGRRQLGGDGLYQDAIVFGGEDASEAFLANTELWNGVSWVETSDLNSARYNVSNAGTTTAALAFGGYAPPGTGSGATEEWNVPSNTVRTITD